MNEPTVVAVGGSLRDESYTRDALQQALSAADAAGVATEHLDLRAYDLPVYDGDDAAAGDADAFRAAIRRADGVLLGTPVYHGTYASALKAALDYCRREDLEGIPVGLLAVAGGRFPGTTLSHLRESCRVLHADVLSTQVALPDVGSLVENGTVVDDEYAERVDDLGRAVAAAAASRDDARCEAAISD